MAWTAPIGTRHILGVITDGDLIATMDQARDDSYDDEPVWAAS